MASNTDVKEIEIDIPIEKINDLAYIQESILDGAFRALKEVAAHGDIEFKDLVRRFINSDEYVTQAFLNKWGLTKKDISDKPANSEENITTSTQAPASTKSKDAAEPPIADTPSVVKPQKKLMVKKKKKLVIKKKPKKKT